MGIWNQVDDGRPMIKYENDDCTIQWFHLECVELTDVPDSPWYCEHCLAEKDV